jgi:hypothetical protein
MRILGMGAKPVRVYVDAKILNMHDKNLPREAYVGYLTEKGDRGAKRVDAKESDDAEVLAILFAIEELRGKIGRITVVCDHESVVSEANRDEVSKPGPFMEELRRVLRQDKSVNLVVLQANPAHKVVTEYVNAQKGKQES